MQNNNFFTRFANGNLIIQILIGIALGVVLVLITPEAAIQAIREPAEKHELGSLSAKFIYIFQFTHLLGTLFVEALRAVAPILVFILVAASIANQKKGQHANMTPIIVLYLIGTFSAALVAVLLSFAFPTELVLTDAKQINPPQGIGEVLHNLMMKLVDNPINALKEANYIGILVWAVGLGIALHHASDVTKTVFEDLSHGVSQIVRFIIRLAPFGIFGLVSYTLAETGFSVLGNYIRLLAVLLSAMLIIALVINPTIVWFKTKRNPYPLVLRCLRESGVTAFFTRSSAANIPVNMALCKKLELDEDVYSVSIPLGATINMAGAAITITILTLAAAHTAEISVDLPTALLLSVVASVSACGASGVAGGSLLLIPLACSLFGISDTIAMQVVSVGFAISVIQDSAETALNSSTDAIFTAAVCQSK